MYGSLLVLLFILLFLSAIGAIVFGYIWLKYVITPFYEAPYAITRNVAAIGAGVSIMLLILTFTALFYTMISYTSEPTEKPNKIIGTTWYEAPMWKNE